MPLFPRKKSKSLSETFNENVGGIICGLLAMKKELGLEFDVVASVGAGAGHFPLRDSVLVTTNVIGKYNNPDRKLSILIDMETGILAYDSFKHGIAKAEFIEHRMPGEPDATTVSEVLEAVKKRAVTSGLLPKPSAP